MLQIKMRLFINFLDKLINLNISLSLGFKGQKISYGIINLDLQCYDIDN